VPCQVTFTMIGVGLIATPTANKRTRPIAAPTGAAS